MYRSDNNPRSKTTTRLEFEQLEPRRLLVQSVIEVPALNLVVNGDFESFVRQGNSKFFDPADVPGWNAMGGNGNVTDINLHVHDNPIGTILSLDSTSAVFDIVFQDVETILGEQYMLAFDFVDESPNNPNPTENEFEVYWNHQLIGNVTAGDTIQTAVFQVVGGSLQQGDGRPDDPTRTRLEFRDGRGSGDRTGDGHSPLIDNVRLYKVTEAAIANGSFESTLPAAGPLLQSIDIQGWNTWGHNSADQLLRIEDAAVAGINPTDGTQFLNLDTDANHVDRVYQMLDTEPGETYFVLFDMRVDGPQDPNRDELRIRWNNQWAATFRSGTDEFQSFGLVVSADSASSLLVMREPGGVPGDGSGPLIDNVQIFRIDRVVNDLEIDLDPATEGLNGGANFNVGSGPTRIAPNVRLAHESGSVLTFAVATNLNVVNANQELLAVDVGSTGISQNYDPQSGRLELRGTASVRDYQNVLRTLTYDNQAANPATGDRTIAFSITDANISTGANFSPRSLLELSISADNAAPQMQVIADRRADFGQRLTINVVATDQDNDPLDYTLSHSAISPGHNRPAIDAAGQITWSPSEAGEVELTVRATDPSGDFAERSFTVNVSQFLPFSGTRSLSAVPPQLRDGIYASAPAFTIDTSKSYEAVINTTAGQMRFELLDDSASIAVNNFINLVRDGFYDRVIFHRVLSGFVAQGGDPAGTGFGGPGYSFVDESPISSFAAGELAMANSGPNTNGSQFFVTLDAVNFATSHTLFGRITSGQNVLNQIVRTHVRDGLNEVPTGNPPTRITSIVINET